MVLTRRDRLLSDDYRATARRHWLDLTAMLALFFAVSFATGRVWRFPFDDELLTFTVAERVASARDFAIFFLKGGDIHPPLGFLGFYGLLRLGLGEGALRLCSLTMTGAALGLFHMLCLSLIARRSDQPVNPPTRLMAILLFGLCPLAVGQGDAIRWYPPFAFLVALFVVLYVAGGGRAARLWSAAALGLAASTNFLALLVALPFMVYRYALERRFRPAFDAAFWLIVMACGSLGLITAYALVLRRFGAISGQYSGFSPIRVVAYNALGIFGGDAVGVGHAWLVAPAVLIAAAAAVAAIDRKRPADPVHFLLLMLAAVPLMTVADFVTPRSYLYLAPVIVTVLVMYLHRLGIDGGTRRGVAAAVLLMLASIGAVAGIDGGARPFKRNAAIPFQQLIDIVRANGDGRVLVLSSEPVLAWLLQHDRAEANRCVSYFLRNAACFASGQTYDSVFVVSGHSNRSRRTEFVARHAAEIGRLTAGKQKLMSVPVGGDDDAALKQWLTGTPLSRSILTIELYR